MYFSNLKKAFLELKKATSLWDFIVKVDCIGNALCGGNYNNTVSGRVGYFANVKANRYWLTIEWIIDLAFRPIEGKGHCYQALLFDSRKKNFLTHRRSSDVALAVLSIGTPVVCLVILPITLVCSFFYKRK